MKILQRFVDGLISQLVSIDFSNVGFVSGNGITDMFLYCLTAAREITCSDQAPLYDLC